MAISLTRPKLSIGPSKLHEDIIRLIRVMSIIKQDGCDLCEAVNMSFTGDKFSYDVPDRICLALDLSLPSWTKQMWYNAYQKYALTGKNPTWEWFSSLNCIDLDDIETVIHSAIERLIDTSWMM